MCSKCDLYNYAVTWHFSLFYQNHGVLPRDFRGKPRGHPVSTHGPRVEVPHCCSLRPNYRGNN